MELAEIREYRLSLNQDELDNLIALCYVIKRTPTSLKITEFAQMLIDYLGV